MILLLYIINLFSSACSLADAGTFSGPNGKGYRRGYDGDINFQLLTCRKLIS